MVFLQFRISLYQTIFDLTFYFKTCIISKVQRTKTKHGFRQLGLIGNLVNTQSHRDCRQIFMGPTGYGPIAYHECMMVNDKLNQQNFIQLATEVLQLKKR